MLADFNVAGKFSFFLIQTSVVLLFFAQLGSGFQKSLEVSLVSFIFEHGDLRKELLFFLFELSNLFFEFVGVHGLLTQSFSALMSSLEFSL